MMSLDTINLKPTLILLKNKFIPRVLVTLGE